MESTHVDRMLQLIAAQHIGHQFEQKWVSRSHFSSIICVENGTGQLVIKAIMPWFLDTLSAAERAQTCELLNASTETFRKALTAHGVPLAETYNMFCRDGYVYHVSGYAGKPGDTHIAKQEFAGRVGAIRQVLKSIAGVLHQSQPPQVGLDTQLANFGFLRKGDNFEVRYLDVFPPLVVHQGECLVHYPNPTDSRTLAREIRRKFMAFGILRRLRFSVLSVDSGLEEPFVKEVGDILDPDLRASVEAGFESLPDAAIKNGYDKKYVRDLIDAIDVDEGIDAIREVGVRLAERSAQPRADFLAEVFDLSRIDVSPQHEEPHEVRFRKLKDLLISLA